jgi:hypothetical protein
LRGRWGADPYLPGRFAAAERGPCPHPRANVTGKRMLIRDSDAAGVNV